MENVAEQTRMTAKQYLKQLKKLDTCIDHKIEERKGLYLKICSPAAPPMDQERVSHSTAGDGLSNAIAALDLLDREINQEIDDFVNQKHNIINQIHQLKEEKYISLLFKRYVEYKRLEVIAVEMNYTYDYVRELHGHALQEFEALHAEKIAEYQSTHTNPQRNML